MTHLSTPRPLLAAWLLVALLGVLVLCPQGSWAQIVLVDNRYYVTEVRPDHNRIGISEGRDFRTRTWVDVEPRTRISTSLHRGRYLREINLSRREMFDRLKPGMRIHVNGGRDWDQHIVAKRIWF